MTGPAPDSAHSPAASRALLVVDVQNDFCEGGALPVTGGAAVAARITEYVAAHRDQYAAIVATADRHVDPGPHFSATPDYVDSWPVHCVADSRGSHFHPAFAPALGAVDAVFFKGAREAAYSGFEGETTDDDGTAVSLGDWLAEGGIDEVDIVGLAADHCVRATALDAVAAGLRTRVLLDLTAGVAPETTTAALAHLREAGVELAGTLPA